MQINANYSVNGVPYDNIRQQIRQSTNIFPDRFLVYGQNIYQMLHLIENNYMNRLKIL